MPILSSLGGAAAIGRGARAFGRRRVTIAIASNTSNYLLNTAKAALYEPGNTDVILTVNSGIVVSSSSTGSFALDIDTSWNANDSITIINNGLIVGKGGNGGRGFGANDCSSDAYICSNGGSSGGPALRAQRQVSIDNTGGTVGGGGGGGAGGGGTCAWSTRSGGGGGGAGSGSGGPGAGDGCTGCFASSGGAGTASSPGSGGAAAGCQGGGDPGSTGGALGTAASGAAGACTSGNE